MGKNYRLGVGDGDGIDPAIVPASVAIAEAAIEVVGGAIEWVPLPLCATAIETDGDAVPASTLAALAGLDA